MLRSLFSRARPDPIRCVFLYFSADRVIVAAAYQSAAGICHEQPEPALIQGPPSAARLGDAFQTAFRKFSMKDTNLQGMRKSDWPAYRASGSRSLKEFERTFRPMTCHGLNASNATVQASVAYPPCPELELSIAFNPLLPSEVVGERLLRLLQAAEAADASKAGPAGPGPGASSRSSD